MSLWWAKKDQLDAEQLRLIETLPLRQHHLVVGPPGSGKTNVLLRRAQYSRSQALPNVLVLTFTRPLTEFVKTGCHDGQGREIFPKSLVSTLEGWIRSLFKEHGQPVPNCDGMDFNVRKAVLANAAAELVAAAKVPRYDAIFVDEAQDLLSEEVALLQCWTSTLFLVGDDRQRIYEKTVGLHGLKDHIPGLNEHRLSFHYRLAPEICHAADRIQVSGSGASLASNSHYDGPRPGRVEPHKYLPRNTQVATAARLLRDQLRVYGDFISQGDMLGVIVPRRTDRDFVLEQFEGDELLAGKARITRARESDERGYDPAFSSDLPICIVTEQGSKGLEFRAAHWLFCDELQSRRSLEMYYTITTRAKTRLDIYSGSDLPTALARAVPPTDKPDW